MTLSLGADNLPPVYDPRVLGGTYPVRAIALTDGTNVLSGGASRPIDVSSIPEEIDADGHTGDINIASCGTLLWYGFVNSVVGASGGATIDFHLDYSDGQGNVLWPGLQKLAQFSGIGNSIVNVGPVVGGAVGGGSGYVLPPAVQIRWVVAGGGTWTGVSHKLFGR